MEGDAWGVGRGSGTISGRVGSFAGRWWGRSRKPGAQEGERGQECLIFVVRRRE